MKIVEEKTQEDLSNVVAYVDGDGDLIVRCLENQGIRLAVGGPYDDMPASSTHQEWLPRVEGRHFYRKGDRITLEF